MANRSYLYAVDYNPAERKREESDKAQSIGEWNYGVPITFKILLSVNCRSVHSLLFDHQDPIAITGEYPAGLERLYAFLEKLKTKYLYDPAMLEEGIRYTRTFFEKIPPQQYFVLECGELYSMTDHGFVEQNEVILTEIRDIEKEKELFYQDVLKQPDEKDWLLGLDAWSDILYYSL